MNKKYFTDALSDEALAEIIDDTLKFKKSAKDRSIKHILKIVPIVAAVLLVIGLANLTPFINLSNNNQPSPLTGIFAENYPEISQNKLTDIPRIIEKSVFESLIERMPEDERPREKMMAYYCLIDISNPDFTDIERTQMLMNFPFIERGAVYIFDP